MSSFRTVELSDPRFELDGLRFLTIKTPNLRGRGDICLYVPEVAEGTTDLPIYLLLHGVYGSHWCWALKGGVHQTAARLMEAGEITPAIVAMPSDGLWGDGSAYGTHHGKQFDRWIVEDVVTAVRENIPAAGPNSKVCIGGLSMGGYGALMLGGRFPDLYAAVSAHSSITRLAEMAEFVEEPVAGYEEAIAVHDVISVLKANRDQLPPVRFDCGTEDPLLEGNRLLHRQLTAAGIAHEYEEFPGGHEWPYWATHVEKTLRFFNAHLG